VRGTYAARTVLHVWVVPYPGGVFSDDGFGEHASSMSDGLVRWPDGPVTAGRVAVITVSYNTRELTTLLLWSLRRILEWESLTPGRL
jgi:hypothetical protein